MVVCEIHLGEILHELAKYKGIRVLEGHLMRDNVAYVFKCAIKKCGIKCNRAL